MLSTTSSTPTGHSRFARSANVDAKRRLRAAIERLDRRTLLDGDVGFGDADVIGGLDLLGGVANPGSISGAVYVDLDKNGVRDAGEPGYAGVTVNFDRDADGSVDATAITNANGDYAVSDLPANGTYRIRIAVPAGYALTSTDPADLTNVTGPVVGPDFGIAQLQTVLAGKVFEDLDGNATLDGAETGIADRVVFIDSNGNSNVDAGEPSVLSDASGNYQFTVDTGGTYQVRVNAGAGYVQTTPNLAPITASTPGGTQSVPDTGVKLIPRGGKLTGFVFGDANGDGVQNNGETGLGGVIVYTDQNDNNVFDAAIEVSTTSNPDGTYVFDFEQDDEYFLKLQLPAGQVQTTPNPGGVIVTLQWTVNGPTFGVRTQPPAPPTISIADASTLEGNAGLTNLGFVVTRTGDLTSASSFQYRVLSNTAVPTSDYVATHLATTVNFAAGEASKTIFIPIRGDIQIETNETFFVQLQTPTNATITRAKATGTIQNDDSAGTTPTVVPDLCDPTKTSVRIDGTVGNDVIQVSNGGAVNKVRVKINNVDKGTFTFTGSILVYGHAGNDRITVDAAVSRTAVIYGFDGNDTVTSAAGNDVIILGEGNDSAVGGGGRDLLIGQNGSDKMDGQSGDDILAGGSTSLDDNVAGLCAIMKEWTRTDRTYDQRTLALRNGGGLNGSYKLNATNVISGGTPPDTITGGLGQDFFFANVRLTQPVRDTVTDKASNEVLIQL